MLVSSLVVACASRHANDAGDTASSDGAESTTANETSCAGLATGLDADALNVPAEVVTPLGVTLLLEDPRLEMLRVTIRCTSSDRVLATGDLGAVGTKFEVEAEDLAYEVSFEWFYTGEPGSDDIEYSLTVTEI